MGIKTISDFPASAHLEADIDSGQDGTYTFWRQSDVNDSDG